MTAPTHRNPIAPPPAITPAPDRPAATLIILIGLTFGLGLISVGIACVVTDPLVTLFHECAEGWDYFVESSRHGSILTGP